MKFWKFDLASHKRIFGLDFLRAFAIFSVLLSHSSFLLNEQWQKWIGWFVFDGVSMFFVLSGFLIGGILIKTLEKHGSGVYVLLNFWSRRWIRTLPNYFLILGVLLFAAWIYGAPIGIGESLRFATFTQNLNSPHPQFYPEAWSLSVEEWFYLLSPLAAFGLSKLMRVKRAMLVTVLSVIVAVTYFRYTKHLNLELTSFEMWDVNFRKQVLTRLDAIMYGVLGAYMKYYHNARWNWNPKMCLLAGILIMCGVRLMSILGYHELGLYLNVFVFSVGSIGTLLLFPFLDNWREARFAGARMLTHVSLVSYSLYLVNLTIVQQLVLNQIGFLEYSPWYKFFCFWVLSFALASVMYKHFEVPAMQLREKFKFSRKL